MAVVLARLPELLFVEQLVLLEVGVARVDDDVRLEVEDALEVAQRDVEQVADAARQPLEEPDVAHRRRQRDVAQALTAHLGLRHLDAALVADHAAVLHALVLAAEALPVGDRAEDLRAEQPVAFGLERAVVDGLRLGHLAVGPRQDLVRRRQADADGVEVRHQRTLRVEAWSHGCAYTSCSTGSAEGFRLLRRLRLLLRLQQFDVQAERLEFADEHVERLGQARRERRVALDDGLVDLRAAGHVVGLRREQLLEDVRRAVRLERPDLHFAEPLAAELRLAAQRLLGDERVRPDRAGVDLVVDQVRQLQHVDVADRHVLLELVARHAVVQPRLAGARQAGLLEPLLDLLLGRAVEDGRREVEAEGVRRPARGASRESGRRSYGTERRADSARSRPACRPAGTACPPRGGCAR